MKIYIATPIFDRPQPEYSYSLALMIPYMKATYLVDQFENSLLSEGRTDKFFSARDIEADYLMFVDSDMMFPPDALMKLIAHKRDIMTGVYFRRGAPYSPIIYDFMPNGRVRNYTTIPDKPFKVDACGAGFLLISKKVLKAYTKEVAMRQPGMFLDGYMGQPFHHISFMTDNGPEQLSEDVSFCHRMKALGFEIWADPSIRLGHAGRFVAHREHYDAMHKLELNLDKQHDENPDGWMTQLELDWLKQAAAQMGSVIEVGSWKGRSTKALLEGCKGTVTAVDHFEGSEDYGDATLTIAREEPIYDIFMKNVGHFPNLKVLKMSSEMAAYGMNGDKADMIFIDSDHRYEQVKAEIERWMPKVKKLICGHDYTDGWPGVKKAVEEKFDKFHVAGSIWFAEVKNE